MPCESLPGALCDNGVAESGPKVRQPAFRSSLPGPAASHELSIVVPNSCHRRPRALDPATLRFLTVRPPAPARPHVARVCTHQLIVLTRLLRGGPVFSLRTTTPSMQWRGYIRW